LQSLVHQVREDLRPGTRLCALIVITPPVDRSRRGAIADLRRGDRFGRERELLEPGLRIASAVDTATRLAASRTPIGANAFTVQV
jgi:hypothetical protein